MDITNTETRRKSLSNAKVFHFLFMPRLLNLFLGTLLAALYLYTAGPLVYDYFYSKFATEQAWPYLPALPIAFVPLAITMAVFLALELIRLHRYKAFLAEELREITEKSGRKEILTTEDPSRFFQESISICKDLGFKPVAASPNEFFLAIRPTLGGVGEMDVVEIVRDPHNRFQLTARPLLPGPSAKKKKKYDRIVYDFKTRLQEDHRSR